MRLSAGVASCLAALLVSGCASLPSLENRPASSAVRDTGATKLGKAIAPLAIRHGALPLDAAAASVAPGKPVKAGLYPLAGGREALAARVVLADAAERALDIQYYIWRSDRSGTFMFNAIRRAADRGVRVRLLLDDNGTAGLDPILRSLDRHPNIEVRLFNPFLQRNARAIGYLTDFNRLHRRMHNKSFTADNQATIIGGRNIGDEYFDATDERAFADLDVLAVGAIVGHVSSDFDRYWSSRSAFPVDRLLPAVSEEEFAGVTGGLAAAETGEPYRPYADAVQKTVFLRDLLEGNLKLEWAMTRMLSDDPSKVLQDPPVITSMPERLRDMFGEPKRLLELVSPYFVPMQEGVDYLSSLARQGVQVRVLTNSLASTDVVAVHAGYSRWRKPLLEAGVTIHEYKPAAPPPPEGGRSAGRRSPSGTVGSAASLGGFATVGSGQPRATRRTGGGSGSGLVFKSGSNSSLHAKTFSVDRTRVVIGSFNLDPRSLDLNTELAFVIDSAALASAVDDAYTRNVPLTAWQVTLTEAGELRWEGQDEGRPVQFDDEPGASFWRRLGAASFRLLPIDWLL